MNRLFCGLALAAALFGSSAARADWNEGRGRGFGHHRGGQGRLAVNIGPAWGLRFERPHQPRDTGHTELRLVSVWVPGTVQQVWVPGRCWPSAYGPQCTPGGYQQYATEGHYENRQESVWVPGWR